MAKLVQVELWSDFIAAGGVRTRVLPISEIFGAILDQDFNGKSELSLIVNARLAELFGGSFGPIVAAVFSQTTDGRVCQDNFTRADSNTIGAPVLFPPAAIHPARNAMKNPAAIAGDHLRTRKMVDGLRCCRASFCQKAVA